MTLTTQNKFKVVKVLSKQSPDINQAVVKEELKAKREELKKKLLEGKKVTIAPDGNVTKGDDSSSIVIPKGKLAVAQWYEKDPGLLMAEKAAMNRYFPGFTLSCALSGLIYGFVTRNVSG